MGRKWKNPCTAVKNMQLSEYKAFKHRLQQKSKHFNSTASLLCWILTLQSFWECFGLPCCLQGQLREAIRDMVLRCPQTLFIFDEAEKLHPGLIDAIKPYMDHYDNVDGVSYRTAIFLFLRLVFYIKHVLVCWSWVKTLPQSDSPLSQVKFICNSGFESPLSQLLIFLSRLTWDSCTR